MSRPRQKDGQEGYYKGNRKHIKAGMWNRWVWCRGMRRAGRKRISKLTRAGREDELRGQVVVVVVGVE